MYNFCSDINGNCDEERCDCDTEKKECSNCQHPIEDDSGIIIGDQIVCAGCQDQLQQE